MTHPERTRPELDIAPAEIDLLTLDKETMKDLEMPSASAVNGGMRQNCQSGGLSSCASAMCSNAFTC